MKKSLPFVLPLLALLLVAYFCYRWYAGRTETQVEPPEVTVGTEIANSPLSETELLDNLRRGQGNFQTVNLEAQATEGLGELRYEIRADKAYFSINANLATNQDQVYEVWLKAAGGEFYRLGSLEENKGGLLESGSVAVDDLPLTVEVRQGSQVVLTGTLPAPTADDTQSPLDNPD